MSTINSGLPICNKNISTQEPITIERFDLEKLEPGERLKITLEPSQKKYTALQQDPAGVAFVPEGDKKVFIIQKNISGGFSLYDEQQSKVTFQVLDDDKVQVGKEFKPYLLLPDKYKLSFNAEDITLQDREKGSEVEYQQYNLNDIKKRQSLVVISGDKSYTFHPEFPTNSGKPKHVIVYISDYPFDVSKPNSTKKQFLKIDGDAEAKISINQPFCGTNLLLNPISDYQKGYKVSSIEKLSSNQQDISHIETSSNREVPGISQRNPYRMPLIFTEEQSLAVNQILYDARDRTKEGEYPLKAIADLNIGRISQFPEWGKGPLHEIIRPADYAVGGVLEIKQASLNKPSEEFETELKEIKQRYPTSYRDGKIQSIFFVFNDNEGKLYGDGITIKSKDKRREAINEAKTDLRWNTDKNFQALVMATAGENLEEPNQQSWTDNERYNYSLLTKALYELQIAPWREAYTTTAVDYK